jgi:hypothetical protein
MADQWVRRCGWKCTGCGARRSLRYTFEYGSMSMNLLRGEAKANIWLWIGLDAIL